MFSHDWLQSPPLSLPFLRRQKPCLMRESLLSRSHQLSVSHMSFKRGRDYRRGSHSRREWPSVDPNSVHCFPACGTSTRPEYPVIVVVFPPQHVLFRTSDSCCPDTNAAHSAAGHPNCPYDLARRTARPRRRSRPYLRDSRSHDLHVHNDGRFGCVHQQVACFLTDCVAQARQ